MNDDELDAMWRLTDEAREAVIDQYRRASERLGDKFPRSRRVVRRALSAEIVDPEPRCEP